MTTPGSFAVVLDESTRRLVVEGEVDDQAAPALRQALAEATADYVHTLTVDLSEVQYLPSAAIGVLVTVQQRLRAAGEELVLLAREGSIAQRVLAVTGVPHRTV